MTQSIRTLALAGTSFAAIFTLLAPPALAADNAEAETTAADGAAKVATEVTTTATGATSYPAGYFAPFSPTTALDIARRVPGFQLDLGNQDVRGFAGAAGNVVINGARPSSKADSLETVLARIPASNVARVEVAAGSLFGSDYTGKAQVLNVVLGEAGGISGNATGRLRRHYTGEISPDVSASVVLKRGLHSVTLAGGTGNYSSREEGTDDFLTFPDLELIEHRRKFNTINDRQPYLSANWAFEEAADRAIRANLRFSPNHFKLHQDSTVTPPGGPDRIDDLDQDYKNRTVELGGDVTRPLGGGAIKLVGLATRTRRDNYDAFFIGVDEGIIDGFEQFNEARKSESIGRLSWTRAGLGGFDVELGAELTYNRLASDVVLFELSEGGVRTRKDLPIDNAVVSEKRAQFTTNVGRALNPALRLEGGVAYEMSWLKVRGDATADRALKFLKPSMTLDYHPAGGLHAQLSVRRTVAQLDFYDFISSAELTSDRVNAGNANLLPQRAWEFRGTVEHPMLGDGLAKLEVGHDRISLLQDRILTEDGLDAPGNLGSATRSFASLTLDAPLDRIGIKGARLKATGTLQKTEVLDPVSNTKRGFTGYWPSWEWNLDYRHDLGKFAYGANLGHRDWIDYYRTKEIDSNFNDGPYATAFVEYRPRASTAVTFDVDNLLNTHGSRYRLFSLPDRSFDPSLVELRERNRRRVVSLTVKQSFG